MLNPESFQYAIENTEVILAPQRRIETFGSTSFRFFLVSELMDRVDEVRVRDGHLHAERPQIITPGNYREMLLEGFGSGRASLRSGCRTMRSTWRCLKYGFQFRKTNVTETLVHSPLAQVIGRLREEVERAEEPLSAIIQGVDEGWEVSLLKFASDLIQDSAGGNMGDFRRRGLL